MRKIIYIDMDQVLCKFPDEVEKLPYEEKEFRMAQPFFFANLEPLKDAIDSILWLDKHFEVYILSTAPWDNPRSWMEKRLWVEKFLPSFKKRLILSHHKNLQIGDYLIDDRTANGADKFKGELILFGSREDSKKFSNWKSVIEYLKEKEGINA